MTSVLTRFQRDHSLYEKAVGEIIRSWPRGGIHIDGGAHLGDHTRAMLARDDVGTVYAVEAIAALCDRLFARFGRESKFRLIRGAIGKKPGEADFAVAVNAPGYSGLVQRPVDAVDRWEMVRTIVTTLDEAIAVEDHAGVGLIKLDLEGGEFDALLGATGIIAKARPCVVFENGLRTSASQYGYGGEEVSEFFESLGYHIYDFFSCRVDQQYWDAVLQTYMFIAVPAEKADGHWLQVTLPAIIDRVATAGSG